MQAFPRSWDCCPRRLRSIPLLANVLAVGKPIYPNPRTQILENFTFAPTRMGIRAIHRPGWILAHDDRMEKCPKVKEKCRCLAAFHFAAFRFSSQAPSAWLEHATPCSASKCSIQTELRGHKLHRTRPGCIHRRPGGEAGIRTLGRALKALQALSRRPRSTNSGTSPGSGGGRGIRTPGEVAPTAVLKTAALDHSAIPPRRRGFPSPSARIVPCAPSKSQNSQRRNRAQPVFVKVAMGVGVLAGVTSGVALAPVGVAAPGVSPAPGVGVFNP